MDTLLTKRKKVNTLWYRFTRYPKATALSLVLVLILASVFWYSLGRMYPGFKLFENLSSQLGFKHNKKYNIYSGQLGGVYGSIGDAITGRLDDDDSIINQITSGGSDNAMNLTIEKNSFGLIQEEIINHDDQLRNNVRVVTPLLMERMHIFYRKGLFDFCIKEEQPQLSANTDPGILKCFSDSVRRINIGPVGSGTRVMASYVMALIQQQIHSLLNSKKVPKFTQVNEPILESLRKMSLYPNIRDSTVDILFYLTSGPMDTVKNLLDSTNYRLISIDPSFVVLLNKEFGLGLRVADFKKQYDSAKNVSTFGTLTYLIASKSIEDADIYKVLDKIENQKNSIFSCLNRRFSEKGKQALFELGFFNLFKDEYDKSINLQLKEVVIFILSVITFFFPVFRSVTGLKYLWERWKMNKEIDEMVSDYKNPGKNDTVVSGIACLKEKLIDMYGDGQLSEVHYNPLMKRVELYCEKFAVNNTLEGKEKIIIPGKKQEPFIK